MLPDLESRLNEKIEQLQQQLNSQNEMIHQMQQQMHDITAQSLISQRNDNKIFSIPFLNYEEIELSHDTDQYFKNLLIWVCKNYKNIKFGTWIGAVSPNSRGWMILTIYDTNDVNQDELPKFCGGCYQTCFNSLYTFCTHDYTFGSKLW